jgi:hypothetical protein
MEDFIMSLENENVNENTITEEQVHEVYTKLEEENTDAEKLAKAEEETEENEYSEIEEIDNYVNLGGASVEDVDEGDEDYIEAFSPYNLSDDDAKKFIEVIADYKIGRNKNNVYNRLPDKIKDIADGFANSPDSHGIKVSKEWAAEYVVKSFINDAKVNKAVDTFNDELNNTMADINKQYDLIFNESIENVFSKIDEIRAEDPVKADRVEAVKAAFDDASTFQRQLDYLDHIGAKKLNKLHGGKRIISDAFYFNTKVNVTEIRVPDIGELPAIIKMELPDYDIDDINKFVSIIVKTTATLPLEGPDNLGNIAYVYKVVSNIYNYKYWDSEIDVASETHDTIFGNITKVLDKIKNIS